MKGASGARLKLAGDIVQKCCKDAVAQAEWFSLAEAHGFPQGLCVPRIYSVSDGQYEMEFIEGHEATRESSLFAIKLCCAWIYFCRTRSTPATNCNWDSYLSRLEQHVRLADTQPMRKALKLFEAIPSFPASFNHGDLTFENVLITQNNVVLIDPNYSSSLFASFLLDAGKMLQSTHFQYHKVFSSNHGVELKRHGKWLEKYFKEKDIWVEAVMACLSHIIRLRKYRPKHQHALVDEHLTLFINNNL